MNHVRIEPAIHYWGTPVVLVSTLNEDGSTNVSPMSSVWWLGWSAMLGLDASSKTTQNLRRHPECVLNLADVELAEAVNRLAFTTGRHDVPMHKKLLGYASVTDKFARGALTSLPSSEVRPTRVGECKVQLEAVVQSIRPFALADARMAIPAAAIEVRIVAAHADPSLLTPSLHIDALRWRPLVMSFRRLFVLGDEAATSRLARGPEDAYAPWKGGALRSIAGRALSAWSRHAYAVPDPSTEEVSVEEERLAHGG